MLRIAVNEQFTAELWGNPSYGLNLDNQYIVYSYHNTLKGAIKLCRRLRREGHKKARVDIVEGHTLNEYALCTRKTYLLKLIQRKWKRLYKKWKSNLHRNLFKAQIGQLKRWPPRII
jgi:hypothetical protein